MFNYPFQLLQINKGDSTITNFEEKYFKHLFVNEKKNQNSSQVIMPRPDQAGEDDSHKVQEGQGQVLVKSQAFSKEKKTKENKVKNKVRFFLNFMRKNSTLSIKHKGNNILIKKSDKLIVHICTEDVDVIYNILFTNSRVSNSKRKQLKAVCQNLKLMFNAKQIKSMIKLKQSHL